MPMVVDVAHHVTVHGALPESAIYGRVACLCCNKNEADEQVQLFNFIDQLRKRKRGCWSEDGAASDGDIGAAGGGDLCETSARCVRGEQLETAPRRPLPHRPTYNPLDGVNTPAAYHTFIPLY